jgi:catechol 2,3-dioxygenase-like lactoylglutathione lyase family enzyme
MKALVYHIQLNVSNARKSLPFYRDMLNWLGYRIVDESPEHIGASNGTTDLWVIEVEKKHSRKLHHRKGAGLNHIAFRVHSKKAVDDFFRKFLKPRKIKTLYQSPKLFPEYSKDYYAVYFEDPDRIKLEVVCFARK